MKSKIISCCLFAIFVFAISFVNAQEKNGDEMNDENLKGIAKSVSISFYNGAVANGKIPQWTSIQYYNKIGKIISYHHQNRSERVTDDTKYSYDTKGHLTRVRYEENGSLRAISIIKYDNSGNLSEVVSLNGDSIQEYKVSYKYSPDRKQVETSRYNIVADTLVNKNVDKLDANGNTIESKVYDRNNKMVRVWRSKYDRMNNFISNAEFNSKNEQVSIDTHVYTYYPNKNMKSDIHYTDGIINSKQLFDEHGNVIEDIMYSGDKGEDIISKETDKYKYDSRGNWTEKVDYENEEAFTSEIRK
jgi:hypothetical protein